MDEKKRKEEQILKNRKVLALIWRLLEIASGDKEADFKPYPWSNILKTLIPINPDRVAKLAANALVTENFDLSRFARHLLCEMISEHGHTVMASLGNVILDDNKYWRFYLGENRELIGSIPFEIIAEWINRNGVEAARRIARQLPVPYLDAGGEPQVPGLTEFIFKEFEDDEKVFREFCIGVHNFQMYSGDIAAQMEQEAEIAKKFLNHPLRRIREWAKYEIEDRLRHATMERQEAEEFGLH